jgi:signal transduction histidine kinase
MSLNTIRNNLLFWKIAGVFTVLLMMLGGAYIGVVARMSKRNFNAINEQLYGDIASHLAMSTAPLKNGSPDTAVTHDMIHAIMLINPSVEVYLLDTSGRIIDFVVPDRSVKTQRVDLQPVRSYLGEGGKNYITGDNPKDPGRSSIFSAAPIYEKGRLTGYVYAILASEKQIAVAASLDREYLTGLGTILFFVTLLVAFLVGTITFFLLTGNISRISSVVERFKNGDHRARIEGKVKGNLGLLASAFNEMADTIVNNMNKMSSMDKLRQELIANVSHDLRSPLAITQGYVETLMIKRESIPDHEAARYPSIILNSLKRLSHLVEQLFEYSKLEANQVQPNKEQFLPGELVSDILMSYEILAKNRGITLGMRSQDDVPAIFADIALVERAIQNLLDNALKFTPPGGRITIMLRHLPSRVEIAVSDTGVGIPINDQPYIFERYKKFPSHEIQNKEGIGLGLAIVKKILDLHQTTIHIDSSPGAGTVFWFQLPAIA